MDMNQGRRVPRGGCTWARMPNSAGIAQGSMPATTYLDCSPSVICDMTVGSIFGQGETWKAYEESMPSNCDKSSSGTYSVSHKRRWH